MGRYEKLHLFDVTLPSGDVRKESKHVCPGDHMTMVDTGLASWV